MHVTNATNSEDQKRYDEIKHELDMAFDCEAWFIEREYTLMAGVGRESLERFKPAYIPKMWYKNVAVEELYKRGVLTHGTR